MKTIPFRRHDVPILSTVDACIAGGSLGGVAAAEKLARTGWRVALVEPRTYLGRELSATLRPWLPDPDKAGDLWKQAPLLQDFAAAQEFQPAWGELPLSLNALKLFLEDRLLAADVQIVYASLPVAVTIEEGGPSAGAVSGLVIGNKSGRQLLRCRMLIDATANGLLSRLAASKSDFSQRADVSSAQASAVFARTLEFDGVSAVDRPFLDVPPDLGLVDDQVQLHRGYRGAEHLLVECRMQLPAVDFSAAGCDQRERQARRQTTRVAAYLLQNAPAFRGATFAAASNELYGPRGPNSEATAEPAQDTAVTSVPMQAFAGPIENLWQLDETVRPALTLHQPLATCALGLQLAQHLLPAAPPLEAASPNGLQSFAQQTEIARGEPYVREPLSPQPGKRYHRAPAGPRQLPVLAEVDVLVVGGGTSGATAALVAGRAGMQTALVEMNPGLGGTGTYGGVHSYWFGRRVGFAAQVTDLAVALHHELRQPPPEGPVPRWNIEAKSQALREAVEDAGVQLFLNAMVIGAIVQDEDGRHAVVGVALATRQGPVALLARVTIDASGDGDVAAHAGAATTYGAARDHVVMWYSLAQFARPGRTRNNFTSMVDVSNVHDYTRAILAGRRRLRDRDHDHGLYVAPRESRHVLGDVQLTLNDQLLQRRWLDVVNVTFSNHDVKGHSTSDWIRLGLIPPNLEVEVPYRALLPRGLDNILVVGKAISATHDALPAIRMQADMENLGGAAALAAAYACGHGCDLRRVDVGVVQKQLVAAGVLPPQVEDRRLVPWRLEGSDLAQAIAQLDARPLISYADMEMDEVYRQRLLPVDTCCAGPQAIPLLEAELARSQKTGGHDDARAMLLAQLLALVGSQAGVPLLVQRLEEALAGPELPARSSHIRYAGAPPDQGAMPKEVYWLHALGMARASCDGKPCALPIWQRVVELLANVSADDVASGVKGIFYYVEAVCAGAERLGAPAAQPLLRRLHGYTPFHDLVCRQGYQVDFFAERRAYLELLIARALARCGSPSGAALLIRYLDDVRALLAAHAHAELVAISGQDLGQETVPWYQWLEAQGEALEPKPYQPPSAPARIWGQEILVAAQAPGFLAQPDIAKERA